MRARSISSLRNSWQKAAEAAFLCCRFICRTLAIIIHRRGDKRHLPESKISPVVGSPHSIKADLVQETDESVSLRIWLCWRENFPLLNSQGGVLLVEHR